VLSYHPRSLCFSFLPPIHPSGCHKLLDLFVEGGVADFQRDTYLELQFVDSSIVFARIPFFHGLAWLIISSDFLACPKNVLEVEPRRT
jgi:hypothetical protein